jgi:antitoxin HigA-1
MRAATSKSWTTIEGRLNHAAPRHPPGEILADELAELGVTPTELSHQINAPPNRVTQIIHGCRGVTGDTALRLGHWFGASAQFWLNLQSAYDIRVAKEKAWQEIAQLPTRPAGWIADPPKQPTML